LQIPRLLSSTASPTSSNAWHSTLSALDTAAYSLIHWQRWLRIVVVSSGQTCLRPHPRLHSEVQWRAINLTDDSHTHPARCNGASRPLPSRTPAAPTQHRSPIQTSRTKQNSSTLSQCISIHKAANAPYSMHSGTYPPNPLRASPLHSKPNLRALNSTKQTVQAPIRSHPHSQTLDSLRYEAHIPDQARSSCAKFQLAPARTGEHVEAPPELKAELTLPPFRKHAVHLPYLCPSLLNILYLPPGLPHSQPGATESAREWLLAPWVFSALPCFHPKVPHASHPMVAVAFSLTLFFIGCVMVWVLMF
jgi:hypothetical protein